MTTRESSVPKTGKLLERSDGKGERTGRKRGKERERGMKGALEQ